jgi:hypothetical protein
MRKCLDLPRANKTPMNRRCSLPSIHEWLMTRGSQKLGRPHLLTALAPPMRSEATALELDTKT